MFFAKRGGGQFKVGETWATEESQPAKQMNAKFQWIVNNTLKGVKDGMASVEGTGQMRLLPLDEAAKPTFELKESMIKTNSVWDSKDGLSQSFQLEQKFKMEGSMQGLTVSVESEIKTTATRVK